MYLLRKRVFTAFFLTALLSFSAWNAWHCWGNLVWAVRGKAPKAAVAAVEKAAEINFTGRMDFVELYAWAQKVMGKREVNNFAYIKDEDGYLHYSSFFREEDDGLFDYALRVRRLRDFVEPRGTKVLVTVAPSKFLPGVTKLRRGLSANDPSDRTEKLLLYLNRLGVETMNLGEHFPNETLSYSESFFKTDHHWTIPAAFQASRILGETLNARFDAGLDLSYLGKDRYRLETYPGRMLGSMGRKSGINFVGMEDFTALWPTFENRYSRDCLEEDGSTTHLEGLTEDCLMVQGALEHRQSVYKDSLYSLYLNGLRPFETIVNETNQGGPTVLFIRDSYFSPVITFLAPCFGKIEAVWSLTDQVDIESVVKKGIFDYIILEYYPYNIEDGAFNFFKEG